MNGYQRHQFLLNEYQEIESRIQKKRFYSVGLLFGIWILLFCLKSLHIQQINWVAAGLFSLFLASRLRDFGLRRDLDNRMTQVTLEGLELEQRTVRRENFFHQVLRNFGFFRVMVLRAITDMMAVCLFFAAINRLALDFNLKLTMNENIVYGIAGFLGLLGSVLYYGPFKEIMKAKQDLVV